MFRAVVAVMSGCVSISRAQMPRLTLVAMVGNHAFAIGIESMVRAFFGPLPIEIGATRLALEAEAD